MGEYYLESLEMYLRTPQVKTCAKAMALKSKLKKWIEDEANDEERERMRKKVEKAPILSLLFEKEGEENNNENVEMTAPQQRTNHPPSEATNALKRNRGRNRSRQKQKKKASDRSHLPVPRRFTRRIKSNGSGIFKTPDRRRVLFRRETRSRNRRSIRFF